MTAHSRSPLRALLLVLASAALAAGGLPAKPALSDWSFGEVVSGEKPRPAALKNKVVVVEYWGVHCPPCILSLPHLAELYKKNMSKGLVIIGAESQGSSDAEIKKVTAKAKVTYPIVRGANGPVAVSGIPHAFVFAPDGELAWDGNPLDDGFDDAVAKAMDQIKTMDAAAAPAAASNTVIVPTRSWTNLDGKVIQAAVRRATATTVTFLMPNCSEIEYPLDKLSRESRDRIAAAMSDAAADSGTSR